MSKSIPRLTGRNLCLTMVDNGPTGGYTAEMLTKSGTKTFLVEWKLDNCKHCGGAIPFNVVGEFGLLIDIINQRVTKMKLISPITSARN